MSSPILGAINAGDPFLMLMITPGTVSVLTSFTTSGGGIGYYGNVFDNCTLDLTPPPIVFEASGTWGTALIRDTINSVNLDYTSADVLGSSVLGQNITLTSQFSQWPSPAIMVSGGPYTLKSASGATLNIRVDFNTGTNPEDFPTIPATSVFFVPVVWYYGCSSTTQRTVNTAAQSLTSYCCSIFSDPICTSQVPTEGWTAVSDCQAGVQYNYCLGGTQCGNSNCKAACPSSDDDCVYSASSGLFVCTFDINNFFQGKWYLQTWFLVLVGTVFVALLILIIVFFLSRRKS